MVLYLIQYCYVIDYVFVISSQIFLKRKPKMLTMSVIQNNLKKIKLIKNSFNNKNTNIIFDNVRTKAIKLNIPMKFALWLFLTEHINI